ncbi:DUF3015 family protein [Fluviispira vulneris]|uniref:DUF3015 family protein n=1 Tax=Fluviispira vulneris TaxID=2763012 RepID=UPI00164681A1|nr:DUF3015 family protein [Fluviispira vulneris]
MFLRKHLLFTFVFCIIPFACFAKTPFGMAGCGLGSQIMGADGNQVFASTTNGTSANQVFGITSGTSNCLAPSKAVALSAQKKFITDNYSILSKEMAQGDGETLRAFSSTFGCKNEVYPSFASQMQNSFSKIFIAPGIMAALDVVQEEIKANEKLVTGCSLVI